jgi:hypothetical protein
VCLHHETAVSNMCPKTLIPLPFKTISQRNITMQEVKVINLVSSYVPVEVFKESRHLGPLQILL